MKKNRMGLVSMLLQVNHAEQRRTGSLVRPLSITFRRVVRTVKEFCVTCKKLNGPAVVSNRAESPSSS